MPADITIEVLVPSSTVTVDVPPAPDVTVALPGGAGSSSSGTLGAQAILWVPGLAMEAGQTVYRVAYEPGYDAEVAGLPSGWRVLESYEWGDTWVDHGDVRVLLGILNSDNWLSTYARATTDGFTALAASGLDLVTVACGGSYGDDGGPSIWVGVNIGDWYGEADPREPATWFWPHLIGANEVRVPSDFTGNLAELDAATLLAALRAIDAMTGVGGGVTSVNGQDGVVVLDAGDVGADPAGTAATAVAALGDAAALDVGTSAGTVAAGNDSRLTDARTPTGGAGGVLSGTLTNQSYADNMVEQGELATALAGYQPLDSDLTAIAALSTTSYGRALLALADAAAGRTALGLGSLATQSGTFSGTSSGTNTGDQDLSGYATTSAVAAGYQPLDSDLTSIAALSTTGYGRAFLALADAAAGRTALGLGTAALSASGDFQPVDSDLTSIAALATTAYGRALLTLASDAALKALVAPTRPDYASWELASSATSGSWIATGNSLGWRGGWVTNNSSPVAGNYYEWAIEVQSTGTYTLNAFHTGQTSGPTYQLSIGGVDVGAATATTTTNNVLARTAFTGISLTAGVTTLRVTIANTGNTTTAIRFGGVTLQRTA